MSQLTNDGLFEQATALGERALACGWSIATAESCTGGWVSQAITSVAGSSQWFDRGFVTYTNLAKEEMLGVSPTTLTKFGAVSVQTVTEMARGALKRSSAQLSVAVSGIAGPSGGTADKPVGTVWFAWATAEGHVKTARREFIGDRNAIRRAAVGAALAGLIEMTHAR